MDWDQLKKNSDKRVFQFLSAFASMEKEAATYDGKKVKLNDPVRAPSGSPKKFYVYVKDPGRKKTENNSGVKKVWFGDPNMSIKGEKSPKKQKNFRARHNCENPGPKTKARYWSCYQWRPGKKVNSELNTEDTLKLAKAFELLASEKKKTKKTKKEDTNDVFENEEGKLEAHGK